MKSISVLATLMSVLSIAAIANAAEPLSGADESYPECGDKEIDAVTDAIDGLAAPCAAKTKYDFLEYPTPTDAQKAAFCTDCAELVAKIKALRPAACSVHVFDGKPYPLKAAFTTLFGKCGVTNVQEAGAGAETAPKSDKKETAKHTHGSGSHDSDDHHAGGSNATKAPSSGAGKANSTTTAPATAASGAATIMVAAVTTTLTVAVASLLM